MRSAIPLIKHLSSPLLVISLSSPSGPVDADPFARTDRTSTAIASHSAEANSDVLSDSLPDVAGFTPTSEALASGPACVFQATYAITAKDPDVRSINLVRPVTHGFGHYRLLPAKQRSAC